MICFVSDLHLGLGSYEQRRAREQRFLRFLQLMQPRMSTLYIVGDLFDYWFEYKTVLPRDFFRTLGALEQLRLSGVRIEYLMGNHDFGHQDFFEHELGIPIHRGDVEFETDGKKFYLAHGDGKVYNDRGYLILRAILRNPINIKLFQWLHPDVGIGLASNTSSVSRSYTDARDYGGPDGLSDFARQKIAEGFDYVIMGHRHQPKQEGFDVDGHHGEYINLGDWLQHDSYAEFDGTHMKLCKVADVVDK